MKKILTLFLGLTLLFSLFLGSGCSCNKDKDKTINIVAPDGAPAIALFKLINENKTYNGKKVNVEIVTANQIEARLISGTADIAVCPTNLAVNLYNKNVDIQMLGTCISGILYLVGTENASSLEELKGKIVYSIGKNNTPDFIFKYVLDGKTIEYKEITDPADADDNKINIIYKGDGSEIIPLLKQGKAKYAILGEPAVTQSASKASTGILFDLQALYKEVSGKTESYPQACAVISSNGVAKLGDELDALLADLKDRNYILYNANKVKTALINSGSLLTVDYTYDILSRCNIDFIESKYVKQNVLDYLQIWKNTNPSLIGGALPGDNFFYGV